MNVLIDDLKFGDNITVDLNDSEKNVTGKFQGYVMPEKQSIIVEYANNPGILAIIQCDSISNISVDEIQPIESNSNIVKFTGKPFPSTFNWIAGNKASLMKTSTSPFERMKIFCEELFSNCNFTQLLQEMAKENRKKFSINFPTYYARIFREPKQFFFDYMSQQQMMSEDHNAQDQSLAMVKRQKFDDNITSLELKMCTLTISENEVESSENSFAMDVPNDLKNLNFDNHDYDHALYEPVKIDFSTFEIDKTVKIGKLIFKSCPQALTDGSMNPQKDESLMEE